MAVRRIGVVTVGRSDFGIYRPVLDAIAAARDLDLALYVSGTHLSPAFGLTVNEVEATGHPIVARVEMLVDDDTPAAIAESMGRGTIGFAHAFHHVRPDVLLVLGDRFEMHAAVVAAVPFLIPVAHIHGGEETEGAIDNALRHSITKLSHLHLVSTDLAARRVRAMGEPAERVVVCGAPALDQIGRLDRLDRAELHAQCGIPADGPFFLVTFHPVTLEHEQAGRQVAELLAAIDAVGLPAVITGANADTGSRAVRRALEDYAAARPDVTLVENLGTRAYFSVMREAAAMVGNSSSGIIEAASYELPVVNVGTRQAGRERSANVYGDGDASGRIVDALRALPLGDEVLRKPFVLD